MKNFAYVSYDSLSGRVLDVVHATAKLRKSDLEEIGYNVHSLLMIETDENGVFGKNDPKDYVVKDDKPIYAPDSALVAIRQKEEADRVRPQALEDNVMRDVPGTLSEFMRLTDDAKWKVFHNLALAFITRKS